MSLHADADILAAHSRPPLRSLAARRATFAATDRRQLSAGRFSHDQLSGPIANDFVNVWAAGRLALDGDPAAYDWNVHKAAEVRALGHASRPIRSGTMRHRLCSAVKVACGPQLLSMLHCSKIRGTLIVPD